MTEDKLAAIVEGTVVRAVTPLVDEIRLLNERLGERLLSVREMEALLGGKCSYRTIYRLIQKGKIKTVSDDPIRVSMAEFQRARRNGVFLRG